MFSCARKKDNYSSLVNEVPVSILRLSSQTVKKSPFLFVYVSVYILIHSFIHSVIIQGGRCYYKGLHFSSRPVVSPP